MGSVSREPIWRVGDVEIDCGERTLVMGILNVTLDSFSVGGLYLDHGAAVIRGIVMVDVLADLIDFFDESTCLGSDLVSIEEERDCFVPVIETFAAKVPVRISTDSCLT